MGHSSDTRMRRMFRRLLVRWDCLGVDVVMWSYYRYLWQHQSVGMIFNLLTDCANYFLLCSFIF